MLKRIKKHPASETFSGTEKALLTVGLINRDIRNLLRCTGKLGLPLRFASEHVVERTLKEHARRSDFYDRVESYPVMQDLELLKESGRLPDRPEVLYVASGDDTCVSRVFPKTLHLDLHPPRRMPRNFDFMQADALDMPIPDSVYDLVCIKAFRHVVAEKQFFKEVSRVLSPGGVVFSQDFFDDIEDSMGKNDIESLGEVNHYYKYRSSLYSAGFKEEETLPNGFLVIGRQEISENEISELNKKKEEAQTRLYKSIAEQRYPYSAAIVLKDFDLGLIDFGWISWEECKKLLEPVKEAIPAETFDVVLENLRSYRQGIMDRPEDYRRSETSNFEKVRHIIQWVMSH